MPEEIKLSESELDRLKNKLDDMADLAEEWRSSTNWSSLHEQYWKQYLCIPDQENKDWPWEGCSNLYLPMTQAIVHGLLAQECDAMFSNDPIIKVVPMDDMDAEDADDLSQYYGDYYYRYVIPLKTFGSDVLKENCIDGTCAIKVRQEVCYNVVREQRVIEVRKPKTVDISIGDLYSETVMSEEEPELKVIEDARVERSDRTVADLCDLEGIWVAPNTGNSLQFPDCRWYYQESELTWEDLLQRRRAGYKVQDDLEAYKAEADLPAKEKLKLEKEGVSASRSEKTVTVREYYMRWPLPSKYQRAYKPEDYEDDPGKTIDQKAGDEEGFWEEIVVTYAPGAREILRLVPLWRVAPDGKRPHIVLNYERIPRFFYGLGVPSMLRSLQRALNTSYNQATDWGTLANAPWGFFNPATMEMPELFSIKPGTMYPTLDPRGAVFPRLQGDQSFQLSNQNQLQSYAERVGAISDVQMGRNPSTPNAPRTFRGMAMQIQQSNIVFSRLVAMHSEGMRELFRRVHAFRRRWAPPDETFMILNRRTGGMRRATVNRRAYDANIDFDFVLNPNRQTDINNAMTVVQMMAPIAQGGESINMRRLYKDLWNTMGKKGFDEIWPERPPPQLGAGGPPLPPGAQGPGPGAAPPSPPPGLPPMGQPMGEMNQIQAMGGLGPGMPPVEGAI